MAEQYTHLLGPARPKVRGKIIREEREKEKEKEGEREWEGGTEVGDGGIVPRAGREEGTRVFWDCP